MSLTSVTVGPGLLRLRSGLLRVQQVSAPPGVLRFGLLATTALLLGGDEVELEVEVLPGADVQLFDVAGTVAYHGRGRPARWRTQLLVAAGARLRYAGLPFVVSDGAEVTRELRAELAAGAALRLRDTVVLGRSGQVGGTLYSRTAVSVDGQPVWREDQDLDPELRRLPGMLGAERVLDSLLTIGDPAPDLAAPAVRYVLPDGGEVLRFLGRDLAASPLNALDRYALDRGALDR